MLQRNYDYDELETLLLNAGGARSATARNLRPDNMLHYIENEMLAEIAEMAEVADIKTGFKNLDEESGGLSAGLYILAAESSTGKTTFALQMADYIAASGHDVIFYSLEQSRLELACKSFSRILAELHGITSNTPDSKMLRTGTANKELQAAAAEYKRRVADRLTIIEGNYDCDIAKIKDYIKGYARRTGTRPVLIIDYLQVLKPSDGSRYQGTKETIDFNITELKRLSRSLKIPVIAISSVNRSHYYEPVSFESLKESGNIEYTADVVWGLQLQCTKGADPAQRKKSALEAKASNKRLVELVCLKNKSDRACYTCQFEYYANKDLFFTDTAAEKRKKIKQR